MRKQTYLAASMFGIALTSIPSYAADCTTIAACNASAETHLRDYAIITETPQPAIQSASGKMSLPGGITVEHPAGAARPVLSVGSSANTPAYTAVELPTIPSSGATFVAHYLNKDLEAPAAGQILFSINSGARGTLAFGRKGRSFGLMRTNYSDATHPYWLTLWDPPANQSYIWGWVTVFLRFYPKSDDLHVDTNGDKLQVDIFAEQSNGARVRYSTRLDYGTPLKSYPSERDAKSYDTLNSFQLFGKNVSNQFSGLYGFNEMRLYNSALTENELQGVAGERYGWLGSLSPDNAPCNTGTNYDYSSGSMSVKTLCGTKYNPVRKWLPTNSHYAIFTTVPTPNSIAGTLNSYNGNLILSYGDINPFTAKFKVEMGAMNLVRIATQDPSPKYLTASNGQAYLAPDAGASAASQYWQFQAVEGLDYGFLRSVLTGQILSAEQLTMTNVKLVEPEDSNAKYYYWRPLPFEAAAPIYTIPVYPDDWSDRR